MGKRRKKRRTHKNKANNPSTAPVTTEEKTADRVDESIGAFLSGRATHTVPLPADMEIPEPSYFLTCRIGEGYIPREACIVLSHRRPDMCDGCANFRK